MDSVEDFCIPMLSRNTMVKFLNVMGGLKEISLNRMVLNYEKKKTLLPILNRLCSFKSKGVRFMGQYTVKKAFMVEDTNTTTSCILQLP